MAKEGSIAVDNCKVLEELGNGKFRVAMPNGKEAICHISGKIRLHKIRVLPDDRVLIEVSPYNLQQGRITYRYK